MKSVLITGGTGFFGQHFIQRLLTDNLAERICIYSRDEWKQAQLKRKLNDDRLRFFIGDVRDRERLGVAMRNIDTVVHAAALKRIEVGKYNPNEMAKTNINGTVNVVDAAQTEHVETVVYLSSDKAFAPISPYGQSKALGEAICLGANETGGTYGPRFLVTRYGNVAGSTGSVIPMWREAFAKNEKIRVTDMDATRFWMFAYEAVQLVLDAINGYTANLAIPTLPAFRVGDLVEAMQIKDYEVIGLPEWEKPHESMNAGNSSDTAFRLVVQDLKEMLAHV